MLMLLPGPLVLMLSCVLLWPLRNQRFTHQCGNAAGAPSSWFSVIRTEGADGLEWLTDLPVHHRSCVLRAPGVTEACMLRHHPTWSKVPA